MLNGVTARWYICMLGGFGRYCVLGRIHVTGSRRMLLIADSVRNLKEGNLRSSKETSPCNTALNIKCTVRSLLHLDGNAQSSKYTTRMYANVLEMLIASLIHDIRVRSFFFLAYSWVYPNGPHHKAYSSSHAISE
jgi:hypothetical protein